jgi:Na+/H+ antiporter NhaD/arsenite permease-like protein
MLFFFFQNKAKRVVIFVVSLVTFYDTRTRTKMMEKEEGKDSEEKRIDAPLFILFSLICALLFFSVIFGSFVKFPTAGSRVVYDRTHKLHSAHDVHFAHHHHHHHHE